ncbi:hypothetical protein [Williamsia sterculiae]|uniref:Uncharacterized protein n=1 Tax=Williamsia sterculiae TaxID=1344003 RepID=A0A1N7GFB8_9NOCA|nr:hypothetical protein [Williamsia sterculiae]SIS11271.1 hypothetical protein SAMN05445060_2719 [Williamsia sterculiae]
MVKTRVGLLPENQLVETVNTMADNLRELRTSTQFVEAKLYEYSSAGTYDMTGTLSSSSGSNQTLALLIVTATSVDNGTFLSTFTPELWIPNLSTPYIDKLNTDYLVTFNQIITDDPTKTQYWLSISARKAVSSQSFYFKAHIYSTVPMTVTFERNL